MKARHVIAPLLLVTELHAAQLSNEDAEARTVVLTEQGVRTSVTVEPGTTLSVCESGCFAAFPAGEMLVLTGDERVAIAEGRARLLP